MVTHGRPEQIGDAVARLESVAGRCGVEVVPDDEAELVVVLGGDGTTLRALHRFLGSGAPCLGVNFGRVGFLTSIQAEGLESGLERAFSGEFETISLPTIESSGPGGAHVGINDVVFTSGFVGRMVIIEWLVDGTPMGELGCDGAILATSTGSTARTTCPRAAP